MADWRIIEGDCVEQMAAMPEASVDAVVCDPPYGLEFMGKAWDGPKGFRRAANDADAGRENVFGRTSRTSPESPAAWQVGFSKTGYTDGGKRTERPSYGSNRNPCCRTCRKHQRGTDRCRCERPDFDETPATSSRLFQAWCEAWAVEALRVLKPGGHLLAFGGSRTVHRLACAIEDAGFEIRDTICWLYGSGFPKSLDVGKAIDAAAGAEREVVGPDPEAARRSTNRFVGTSYNGGRVSDDQRAEVPLTAPATPDAQRWQGWGTALKPSHEPVVVAQKPRTERDILDEIGSRLDTLEAWLAQAADPTTRTGEADVSFARTDTCPSESTAGTFSNTVTSWRNCWAELWTAASTSTTSTEIRPTTALTTLWSSLSEITRESITPARMRADGWRSLVEGADSLFAAAVLNSRATRALSAHASATGSTLTNSPDGDETSRRRPAHEPIVVARKPLAGTVAGNVLAHGTGALNVDGCRVGMADDDPRRAWQEAYGGREYGDADNAVYAPMQSRTSAGHDAGRWPANVILDPEAAALLDAQTGESVSRPSERNTNESSTNTYGWAKGGIYKSGEHYGDSGGASRFFYCAKSSSAERNAGLDGFEAEIIPYAGGRRRCRACGAWEWRPQQADLRRCECGDGADWENVTTKAEHRNVHPTVKPIALMRWLVRLVTPPGGLVLDPFAGSGTTGAAAMLEGFRFVGIEREPEYAAIARARIAWWAEHPDGMELVERLEHERARKAVEDAGQLDLFAMEPEPSTSPNGRDGEATADARYTDRGATTFSLKPGRRRAD